MAQRRGDLAQMVERSLSMREALGSMPRFSKRFTLSLVGRIVAQRAHDGDRTRDLLLTKQTLYH